MKKVEIYTRKMCGYCMTARRLLSGKPVELQEYDATFDAELRKTMMERAPGHHTFPQIFIENRHIGGCTELLALEASGELDRLLADGVDS